MFWIGFSRIGKVAGAVALTLCLLMGSALAETFVSYNGQFHFSYPNTWTQIDYTTAEFYLTRGDTTQQVDFEAVFCNKETLVLFRDQYLVLTVDTIGALNSGQIDSVLNSLTNEFKRPVKEVTSAAFLLSPDPGSIVLDRAGRRLAMESEVPGDSSGPKINLLVMKFYERGIANFYFYAPVAKYASSLPDFLGMVTSFSTEPLPTSAPTEPVKIADLDKEPAQSRNYTLWFGSPIIVILIILIVKLRKKRQPTTSSDNQKG
jgi:hypothetical protein